MPAIGAVARVGIVGLALVAASGASAMDFCSGAVRVTCVVDGDTFWLDGEKIRIADIDTPETSGGCVAERVLAARAAGRLSELLDVGPYDIERQSSDQYGRTLAVIRREGVSLGEMMVKEGVARPWRGHREQWCE